jgi:hypothetical protein
MAFSLLQIGFGDADYFFNGIALMGLVVLSALDQMETYVSLEDFRHQAVNGASARGDLLKDFGTFILLLKQPFDGFNLAAESADAIQ